jgi:hypothetical protein
MISFQLDEGAKQKFCARHAANGKARDQPRSKRGPPIVGLFFATD